MEWRGPATVIGSKGGVYHIVHQSEVLRVAGCRLVEANNEQEQNNPVKQTETKTGKDNKNIEEKKPKPTKMKTTELYRKEMEEMIVTFDMSMKKGSSMSTSISLKR